MTAERQRWARLRRALWHPPRPHGAQPHERTVGPLELFYDLAVSPSRAGSPARPAHPPGLEPDRAGARPAAAGASCRVTT